MSRNEQAPTEAPPAYTATDHLQVPTAAAHSSAAETTSRHRRTSSAGSTRSSNYTTDEEHYDDSDIPEEVRYVTAVEVGTFAAETD